MSDSGTSSKGSPLRRWLAIGVLALLAIASIALWSFAYRGSQASRRLRERLAEYARRGEPVSIADLQPPAVPDGDNAALDYLAAAALAKTTSPAARGVDEIDLMLPWTPQELTTIRAALVDCAPALERVAAAANKRRANWGVAVRSPLMFLDNHDQLSSMRHLVNRLAAAALEAHVRGDDGAALRHAVAIFHIASALDQMPGGMISHLVATGCRAAGYSVVRQVAPDLAVGASPAADPRRVRELVAELIDDAPASEGWRRAMLYERAAIVDAIDGMLAGTFRVDRNDAPGGMTAAQRLVWRAQWLTDSRLIADYITDAIRAAAGACDLPAALANPNPLPDEAEVHAARHSLAMALLLPATGRSLQTSFRAHTESHAAAVALAIRLHAIDHGGALPRRLEELVPGYLAAIPTDPLAAGAPPLRFIADAADPRIYSVGSNGKDDGGSERPERAIADPDRELSPWECLDAVFHYQRPPRHAPKVDEGEAKEDSR